MERAQNFIAAPIAIPASVVASLLGFHLVSVIQNLLTGAVRYIRQSNIDVLDSVLKPPLAFLLNLMQASFGTKYFSPNVTQVLLGAIIIIIVWQRL
jgi:hypothetical protein